MPGPFSSARVITTSSRSQRSQLPRCSRVVDPQNFEVVLQCLTPAEVGCLYCRIGWMKLFNPMKPEGSYELDLGSHWEERMVVKSLCTLATNEPGENWPCFSFRWSDMEIIPGWALTSVWLTDAGLPPRGVLSLTFYTGDGQGNFGCYAHVAMRRALCAMFHVDERCALPPPCGHLRVATSHLHPPRTHHPHTSGM